MPYGDYRAWGKYGRGRLFVQIEVFDEWRDRLIGVDLSVRAVRTAALDGLRAMAGRNAVAHDRRMPDGMYFVDLKERAIASALDKVQAGLGVRSEEKNLRYGNASGATEFSRANQQDVGLSLLKALADLDRLLAAGETSLLWDRQKFEAQIAWVDQ